MMVNTKGSMFNVLRWQWKIIAFFGGAALGAFALHWIVVSNPEYLPGWVQLPALPLGVVGGALGIFVSFRTNSAYDRWWEGRKLWGRMINTSRHMTSQVVAYIRPLDEGLADHTVRRHAAYVHVLRCLLREQDPWDDGDIKRLLRDDERAELSKESNATHALLQSHLDTFASVKSADGVGLAPLRLQDLDESVRHLLDIQGGCERIKKTPLPRGYGYFAERLIQLYAIVLPLAIVGKLGWVCIPLSIVVCLSFTLISEAGRVLEDPFTLFYNGLPLFQMSRMIEVNIHQRLGHLDLPEIPVPDEYGVLM